MLERLSRIMKSDFPGTFRIRFNHLITSVLYDTSLGLRLVMNWVPRLCSDLFLSVNYTR